MGSSDKHTPGPWQAKNSPGHGWIVIDESVGHCVCETSMRRDQSLCSANARLIAAAPDMLEALQAIDAIERGDWDHHSLVKQGPLHTDRRRNMVLIARDAIAKATGDTKGGAQ